MNPRRYIGAVNPTPRPPAPTPKPPAPKPPAPGGYYYHRYCPCYDYSYDYEYDWLNNEDYYLWDEDYLNLISDQAFKAGVKAGLKKAKMQDETREG